MIITLDRYFHIISFKIKGSNISYGISQKIEWLRLVRLDEDGYMEFETNVGIESIDLLDDDTDLVSSKQKERIMQELKGLTVDSVKVRIK